MAVGRETLLALALLWGGTLLTVLFIWGTLLELFMGTVFGGIVGGFWCAIHMGAGLHKHILNFREFYMVKRDWDRTRMCFLSFSHLINMVTPPPLYIMMMIYCNLCWTVTVSLPSVVSHVISPDICCSLLRGYFNFSFIFFKSKHRSNFHHSRSKAQMTLPPYPGLWWAYKRPVYFQLVRGLE